MPPNAAAIREQLDRIVNSPEFSGQERLKKFLLFVVEETLAGRSDQIKEIVIGISAYGKSESYDPRLDSIVRVEAVKLRTRLARYYERTGKSDAIVISIPKGGYVPMWEYRESANTSAPPSRRQSPLSWVAVAAGTLGLLVFIGYARRPLKVTNQRNLIRITADSGVSATPAISPNGELIAYASDRCGAGNLDLWIQPISGGSAVRLTDWPGDELMPDFAPDGSRIVFRQTSQNGDALYTVPTLGGEPRLLTRPGSFPRFSPDGKYISFDTPQPRNITSNLDSSRIYVLEESGQPVQLCKEFTAAHNPVWLPDAKHILFLGLVRKDMDTLPDIDWWVTPLDECKAVRTGFASMMRARDRMNPKERAVWNDHFGIVPLYWRDGSVIFTLPAGDAQQVWSVNVNNHTFQVDGQPIQVTFGTGQAGSPSHWPGGTIAFTDSVSNIDIFSLPISPETGKVRGSIQRLTDQLQVDLWPSISRDGRQLAFWSDRERPGDVWLKDLTMRTEKALTSGPRLENWPEISPDGSWVSFHLEHAPQAGKFDAYRVSADGVAADKLCDLCSFMGETRNGSHRIYRKAIEARPLMVWNRQDGKERVLVAPENGIATAALSPDEKWIVFGDFSEERRSQIFLIPFQPDRQTPRSEWIPLTEPGRHALTPTWSPLGNVVYFQLIANSEVTLMARKIRAGRPTGSLFTVFRLDESGRSLANIGNTYRGFGVGGDLLVFPVRQTTSNIWLLR